MDAVSKIYLKPARGSVVVRNIMTCENDVNDDTVKNAPENEDRENMEKLEEDPLAEEKTVDPAIDDGEGLNNNIEVINNPLSPRDEDNNESSFNRDTTTVFDNVMVIVNEQDPMDLLMPLERGSRRSSEGTDDESDDEASGTMTKEDRWERWVAKFEWLLHEESNGDFAYCLYCDVTVHIASIKYIKQHGISLYHHEREENYLAFKAYEEKTGGSIIEIKQEYGTENRVAALKYQRIAQAKSLSNFNWMRWMQSHCWLVREQDDGTIGYCEYCKTRLNVEFTYLRKRHETSKGHREAERVYKKREIRKLVLEQGDRGKRRNVSENEEIEADDNEEKNEMTADEKDSHTNQEKNLESDDDNGEYCEEKLKGTLLSRCIVCNIKITRVNFRRHLGTKGHLANLADHKTKQRKFKEEANLSPFLKYAGLHPWLTSHPDDADVGYCKVCQKRFMYGHSESKRIVHENGLMHRSALENDSSKQIEVNNDNEDIVKEDSQSNDQFSSELINDENNEEDDFKDKKRKLRGSKEWYRKYLWCKPYPKDPNYMFCTYCNILLLLTNKRKKHQLSKRHKNAEMIARKAKTQTKPVYSWISYSNNKKVQFCKYCHVRFLNESSKARHEHSSLHKQAMMRYMAKKTKKAVDELDQKPFEETSEQPKQETKNHTLTVAPTAVDRQNPKTFYAMVKQWKSRFPWLSYKRTEDRANYGWCKLCEVSFFVASYKYASKHQRSGRHLRAKLQQARLAKRIKSDEQSADYRERFSWLEPEADENYCRCRVCDMRLTMKVLYIRQHENSKRHIMQMEASKNGSSKKDNRTGNATSSPASQSENLKNSELDSDVLLIEDTETNDIVSLKSESSTDGGERFVDEVQMLIDPPPKRVRTSRDSSLNSRVVDVCQSMLNAVDQLKAKRKDENSPLAVAEGIISSSLSIAACLSPLMQQLTARPVPATATDAMPSEPKRSETPSTPTVSKRDNIDLFFESVGQTLRSLPIDLIAEGKMKIMQTMYELEMTAMSRKNGIDIGAVNSSGSTPTSAMPNTKKAAPKHSRTNTPPNQTTSENTSVNCDSAANGYSSEESTVIIDEIDDLENPLHDDRTTTNTQHSRRPSQIIDIQEQQQLRTQRFSINSNNNGHPSNGTLYMSISNNEIPKRNLHANPSDTVQHTAEGEPPAKLRCVPLNTLTSQMLARQQQKQHHKQSSPSMPTYTRSSDSTPMQLNRSPINAPLPTATHSTSIPIKNINVPISTSELNGSTLLRRIRLSSSTQSKFITLVPCATSSTSSIRVNAPSEITTTTSVLTTRPTHISQFSK